MAAPLTNCSGGLGPTHYLSDAPRPPLRRKEFSSGFRQVCCFDFAGDAAFKFWLKRRARSVNHDHVFRTFGPNRVRDAWRNHNAHIVAAAMIVAIDKKAHVAHGETGAHIA